MAFFLTASIFTSSQNFSDSSDENEVYISKAFAEKFNIHQGDMITLSEKYEHKDYTWKVYDIYDYSAGIAVFMTNQKFNQIFEKDADEFSGYMADNPITDIDEDYIAKKNYCGRYDETHSTA